MSREIITTDLTAHSNSNGLSPSPSPVIANQDRHRPNFVSVLASPVSLGFGLLARVARHLAFNQTIGNDSDDFLKEISKLEASPIDSLGGVATKEEILSLRSKTAILGDGRSPISSNSDQYIAGSNAILEESSYRDIAEKIRIYDFAKRYGIDEETLKKIASLSSNLNNIHDDEEMKKIKNDPKSVISAQLSQQANLLDAKNNELNDLNKAKLLFRVLSIAITCGGLDAVSWFLSLLDCFAGAENFSAGVQKAIESKDVMGPFSEINKTFGVGEVFSELSKFPILSEINNGALTVSQSAGPALELGKSLIDNDLARFIVPLAVGAWQLSSELRLNSKFNEFAKETKESVAKCQEKVASDVDEHHNDMARFIVKSKFVDTKIDLKIFEKIVNFLLDPSRSDADKDSKASAFNDIQILDESGQQINLGNLLRGASSKKDIHDVVVMMAKDPQNISKFKEKLNSPEFNPEKTEAQKELFAEFLENKDLEKINNLKSYVEEVKSNRLPLNIQRVVANIDASDLEKVLLGVAVELFKTDILHDIKTKNGYYERISTDSRSPEDLIISKDRAGSRNSQPVRVDPIDSSSPPSSTISSQVASNGRGRLMG